MKPIITSRWETDAYKLSMGQVFWQRFPDVTARYEFVDRNNTVYPAGFAEKLREQVEAMAHLPANADRADYIKQKWPFMNNEFLNWYTFVFRHKPEQVLITQNEGKLSIVVEGPIAEATHWEIPLLRIISCLYTEATDRAPKEGWLEESSLRAQRFYKMNVALSEFGGRRPHSTRVHFEALAASAAYKQLERGRGGLIGTSWLEYAYQLGLRPIGTQAHEYTSMLGGYYGHLNANKRALEIWIETYGTRLGYVLPDTYTTPKFLEIFGHGYADLFEGSRQDSGNPYWYAKIMVDHLRKVDVDPQVKSIIHSNIKNEDEVFALNTYMPGAYLRSFGLGWMITNNCGYRPYNTIIKLFGIKIASGLSIPTIKISDDPGKAVGNPLTIETVIKYMDIRYPRV